MGVQKWDKIGSGTSCTWRGTVPDWQLRVEFCHPDVCAYVEHMGHGGRSRTPRYRVRIVGPLMTGVLVFKSGKECRWTLSTAKRKAEMVADYPAWLIRNGFIQEEAVSA